MKYPENITAASRLRPDFLGFIFWKQSPRYFDGIIPELPDAIKKVGVFVDAPLDEIISKARQHQLDFVQLHGNETVAFCLSLKNQDIRVIKVFSIGEYFNFEIIQPYEAACDYFLFDTKGKMPGGNGTAFNWKLLEGYSSSLPIFLSGGIGIKDIDAIRKLDFPVHAIDLNSKFEIRPGLKDIELLGQALQLKK